MRVRPLFLVLLLIAAAALAARELAPRLAGATSAAAPPAGSVAPPPPARPPQPEPPATRARVKFDSVAHDFGLAPHGTVIRHTYRYANAGEDPLEVLDVRTSCGCTAAEPTKRRLLPGEGGEITASFDSSKKGAGRGKQRFTNSIFFRTNDPTARDGGAGVTRLTLVGDVVARYRLIPDAGLVFRTFARDAAAGGAGEAAEAASATCEVVPSAETLPGEAPVPPLVPGPGPDGVRVLGAPPLVEVFGLRAVERDGRRGVAIDCAVREEAPVGLLDGAIRLATGNSVQPEVVVPVRGMVRPPVQAAPPRLFLAREQANVARAIRIVAARPVDVLAVRVATADGAPAPLAAEPAPGGQIAVRQIAGADPAGGAAGDVLIFLSDPKHPVLRVPYLIRDMSGQRAEAEAQRAAGVRVSPTELFLGEIDPDHALESAVIVARSGAAAVDLRDIMVEPPGALETRIEAVTPGQVARILLKPTAGGAAGPIAARLSFLPRPEGPRLSVRVTGRALPRVTAAPEALQVLGGRPAEVVLRRRDGAPLRALSAAEPSGRFEVRVEPAAAGTLRVLAAPRAPAAAGAAPWFGEVVVRTDAPGEEEVRIPLVERPGT